MDEVVADLVLDGFPVDYLLDLPLPALGELLDTVLTVRDRRRLTAFWDRAWASQGTGESLSDYTRTAFPFAGARRSESPDTLKSF